MTRKQKKLRDDLILKTAPIQEQLAESMADAAENLITSRKPSDKSVGMRLLARMLEQDQHQQTAAFALIFDETAKIPAYLKRAERSRKSEVKRAALHIARTIDIVAATPPNSGFGAKPLRYN
jgi:hypothetical protein